MNDEPLEPLEGFTDSWFIPTNPNNTELVIKAGDHFYLMDENFDIIPLLKQPKENL